MKLLSLIYLCSNYNIQLYFKEDIIKLRTYHWTKTWVRAHTLKQNQKDEVLSWKVWSYVANCILIYII